MESGTWTWFDHTADIGLEVSAPSIETLFSTAAIALFDLLLEARATLSESRFSNRHISIDADNPPELLVRWLAELLYLHETEHLIFRKLQVTTLSRARLAGMVSFEPFNPAHHRVKREIKGITYHQLTLEKQPAGWRTRLVLDV